MVRFPAPFSTYFLGDMSPVIRWLIVSDMICLGAGALFAPLFALYTQEYVIGFDAAIVVGTATAIYLLVKSVAQIPMARIIDKICGERDDFQMMFWGMLITSVLPLGYLFVSAPIHLYLIQFAYGLATAATFPSFLAIFTRHIDHGKEGTEWGVYYTTTDVTSAAMAAVGGVLAYTIGFQGVIFALSALSFVGTLLLLPIRGKLRAVC